MLSDVAAAQHFWNHATVENEFEYLDFLFCCCIAVFLAMILLLFLSLL